MRPDGQRQTVFSSFKNAARGLGAAFKEERNLPFDCLFALVPVVLGFIFRISLPEWLAIIVCIGLVVGMELMNTALESIVDLASPDMHHLAGRAKDCAAAACLVSSISALIVGIVIFAPRILQVLFSSML